MFLFYKNIEVTFVVISMAADSQLRKRDLKDFCDNSSPKSNNLDRMPLQRTLKNCDKDTEV